MKNIHILGGGTFSYVRSHMALAAQPLETLHAILRA